MTVEEQQKTGVAGLSYMQKKELESWINDKFTLKTTTASSQPVYLGTKYGRRSSADVQRRLYL